MTNSENENQVLRNQVIALERTIMKSNDFAYNQMKDLTLLLNTKSAAEIIELYNDLQKLSLSNKTDYVPRQVFNDEKILDIRDKNIRAKLIFKKHNLL